MNYVTIGTITAIKPFHNFDRNSAVLEIELPDHSKTIVFIPRTFVRKTANDILGYNSKSLTEICETFIKHILNATYIRWSEYFLNEKGHYEYKTHWGIMP